MRLDPGTETRCYRCKLTFTVAPGAASIDFVTVEKDGIYGRWTSWYCGACEEHMRNAINNCIGEGNRKYFAEQRAGGS